MIEQLRNADEAFLTSTAGGIMPINTVDGKVLGGKAGPGELATKLHNLYWSKRWDGWLGTAVAHTHTTTPNHSVCKWAYAPADFDLPAMGRSQVFHSQY
ncbi:MULTISPECIES: hypothetical protein [unclassified Pseudomonas]|uniref:hypothetical protein n=1 Tax=unclassified Pseudomonas TaxID=196821 RepID=UPI001A90CE0C|nr:MULTISPECIES: hypothetical protein [unclassified Pseudomonas]